MRDGKPVMNKHGKPQKETLGAPSWTKQGWLLGSDALEVIGSAATTRRRAWRTSGI
jgi:hypothetical protein